MRLLLISTVVVVLSSLPAALAAPATGANGGPVAVVDGHPIEMVATDQVMTFYLSDDDGSPLSTKGVTARAIVRTEGKTLTVPLTSEAPNKLTGSLPASLTPGSKVVLSAKLHGHNLQARFEK